MVGEGAVSCALLVWRALFHPPTSRGHSFVAPLLRCKMKFFVFLKYRSTQMYT